MSDIFREVDEALQREKAAKLWKDYGPTLVLAAIILVVGTGVVTGYRAWTSSQNKAETSKLVLAAEEKDIAASMEKAGADTKGGHKAVALMNAASRYADKKDFKKAAALYDGVAQDGDMPSDLRDLSTIYYVRAKMLADGEAKQDYKALAAKLDPIAKDNGSSFQLQAKLDAALLYGNGLKDYTKALELLQGFEANSATDSLKEKASALQHVYEYEVSKASPAATAPAAGESKKQ